jgi:micrococcal nuclease
VTDDQPLLVDLTRTYGGVNKLTVDGVHDGDTLIVTIPSWPRVIGQHVEVRLYGVDAPELEDPRPEVAEVASRAKERVVQLVSAGPVHLRNLRRDKYFRLLPDVLAGGVNVAAVLLAEGLARPYTGRGPKPW